MRHKPPPGATPRLSKDQRARVHELLAQGAQAHGFRGEAWTCERVAIVIRREFAVGYHPTHVSRLLKVLRRSLQKPQRRANQRDEEAMEQLTRYPWDGDVTIEIAGEGEFSLMVRIPSWSEEGASITVNDEPSHEQLVPGSYAEIRRAWRPGDKVLLHLPMTVRRVESHPYVVENSGRVALIRGPLLYCIEHADNLDLDPREVILPQDEDISVDFLSELLGGVAVLKARATAVAPDKGWEGILYRTARYEETDNHARSVNITAVPYYAWANREPGPMLVWLQTGP